MNPINIEVMLLAWAETHNGGAKIVLQLADPADLEPFKAMTVKHGKVAGQRLACAFVQIGDDEKPVAAEHAKGGALAQLAGRWCQDERFHEWLQLEFPTVWADADKAYPLKPGPETLAARVVRDICCVASRAELDHNPAAAFEFHTRIREPFAQWLVTHGW